MDVQSDIEKNFENFIKIYRDFPFIRDNDHAINMFLGDSLLKYSLIDVPMLKIITITRPIKGWNLHISSKLFLLCGGDT